MRMFNSMSLFREQQQQRNSHYQILPVDAGLYESIYGENKEIQRFSYHETHTRTSNVEKTTNADKFRVPDSFVMMIKEDE